MFFLDKCPIETALHFIRNKWSLEIIRDLFLGRKRFNEFRKSNPKLSNNVLSERLKELIKKGLIEKKIDDDLRIEYQLTQRGRALNKVLYELAVFTCNCVEENKNNNSHSLQILKHLRNAFKIENT